MLLRGAPGLLRPRGASETPVVRVLLDLLQKIAFTWPWEALQPTGTPRRLRVSCTWVYAHTRVLALGAGEVLGSPLCVLPRLCIQGAFLGKGTGSEMVR